MESHPSGLQESQAFDSYVKKILKGGIRDHYRKTKRRGEREVSFSELTSAELAKLAVTDKYFTDEHSFDVLEWKIGVADQELAEALNELPEDRRERDIVLLSYFLDMTDKEIAERLELPNSTVAYRRTSTLKKLKRIMEENADE